MKKDSLICFRASRELHDSLTKVAKDGGRSLSSTIEIVLSNYLKEGSSLQSFKNEKRRYPRKALSVPAVINNQESGQMGIGAITDISLGGARLLLLKDIKHQIPVNSSQRSTFEIVFILPNENKPITLSCEANRLADAEDSTHIGASFVDADFKSYKALQTYLM
jgi:hypothetical protein